MGPGRQKRARRCGREREREEGGEGIFRWIRRGSPSHGAVSWMSWRRTETPLRLPQLSRHTAHGQLLALSLGRPLLPKHPRRIPSSDPATRLRVRVRTSIYVVPEIFPWLPACVARNLQSTEYSRLQLPYGKLRKISNGASYVTKKSKNSN